MGSEVNNSESREKALTYIRVVFSTLVSIICIILIFYGIFSGYAQLKAPHWLQFCLLVALITLLAYLEGLQVYPFLIASIFTNLKGCDPCFGRHTG
jgi:cytochrome bd-type quinol oxidase subunit 2